MIFFLIVINGIYSRILRSTDKRHNRQDKISYRAILYIFNRIIMFYEPLNPAQIGINQHDKENRFPWKKKKSEKIEKCYISMIFLVAKNGIYSLY